MTITAKYASRCATCGQPIAPGTQIEWVKGSPVRHTQCPPAGTAPTTPNAAPASSGPATDAQRRFLRGLADRLERVAMFDSFATSGPAEAAKIRTAIRDGALSRREASELIARAKMLVDDEM